MGVNINVLDQSLRRIAVVDDYTSLIWAKRYYDIGALDLQIEATKKNLEIFKKYNYITRDDDDAVFRIEALELDTSVEDTNYLIIGAYDCKKILTQRIVWNQFNFKAAYDLAVQKNGATLPVTFKMGEKDGVPVYHTFETMEEADDFYTKAVAFINQTLAEGWAKKDNFDWSLYTTPNNNNE